MRRLTFPTLAFDPEAARPLAISGLVALMLLSFFLLLNDWTKSRTHAAAVPAVLPQSNAEPEPAADPAPVESPLTGLLDANPQFASRVERLLPPAANPYEASAGFNDVKEFLTATHVSRNLGIALVHVKNASKGKTLAKAIRQLNPNVYAPGEVARAQKQAASDLKSVPKR